MVMISNPSSVSNTPSGEEIGDDVHGVKVLGPQLPTPAAALPEIEDDIVFVNSAERQPKSVGSSRLSRMNSAPTFGPHSAAILQEFAKVYEDCGRRSMDIPRPGAPPRLLKPVLGRPLVPRKPEILQCKSNTPEEPVVPSQQKSCPTEAQNERQPILKIPPYRGRSPPPLPKTEEASSLGGEFSVSSLCVPQTTQYPLQTSSIQKRPPSRYRNAQNRQHPLARMLQESENTKPSSAVPSAFSPKATHIPMPVSPAQSQPRYYRQHGRPSSQESLPAAPAGLTSVLASASNQIVTQSPRETFITRLSKKFSSIMLHRKNKKEEELNRISRKDLYAATQVFNSAPLPSNKRLINPTADALQSQSQASSRVCKPRIPASRQQASIPVSKRIRTLTSPIYIRRRGFRPLHDQDDDEHATQVVTSKNKINPSINIYLNTNRERNFTTTIITTTKTTAHAKSNTEQEEIHVLAFPSNNHKAQTHSLGEQQIYHNNFRPAGQRAKQAVTTATKSVDLEYYCPGGPTKLRFPVPEGVLYG
jgi:hypothetical protein